jgi:hypothetical protein
VKSTDQCSAVGGRLVNEQVGILGCVGKSQENGARLPTL